MMAFISFFGVVPSIVDLVEIYCDNNGAIILAKEPRSYKRSNHILKRYHLVQEFIGRGDIKVSRVSSKDDIVILYLIY